MNAFYLFIFIKSYRNNFHYIIVTCLNKMLKSYSQQSLGLKSSSNLLGGSTAGPKVNFVGSDKY
jgi:hypothetical protein